MALSYIMSFRHAQHANGIEGQEVVANLAGTWNYTAENGRNFKQMHERINLKIRLLQSSRSMDG